MLRNRTLVILVLALVVFPISLSAFAHAIRWWAPGCHYSCTLSDAPALSLFWGLPLFMVYQCVARREYLGALLRGLTGRAKVKADAIKAKADEIKAKVDALAEEGRH